MMLAMNDGDLDSSEGRRATRMIIEESSLLDASSSKVQRYIKDLSSAFSEPSAERTVDEELLAGVIREAGEYSFGVAAVEVYSFDDSRLVPVGIWSDSDNAFTVVAPGENVPGVCLVGTLWAEQAIDSIGMRKVSSLMKLSSSLEGYDIAMNEQATRKPLRKNGLVWREFDTILQDPDATHGERLKDLRASGYERAAGVSFESNGSKGTVVHYVQEGVDSKPLSAVANEIYLKRSAELIGSILSMIESRRACVAFQHRFFQLEKSIEESGDAVVTCTEDDIETNAAPKESDLLCFSSVGSWLWTYLRKFRGGGSQIPPAKPIDESLWTLLGAFSGLIVLSSLNQLFHLLSQSEFYLLMGPFGALMTLQYGLTPAPASQPRNVIMGQIVAGAVSISFTYIPDSVMPVWIRQAVAPAFAIATMVKLGIPHPPAGAHSVIYAEGKHNWGFYALVVLCSIVSIVPATVVNNLSRKRQYPIYWGYLPDALARRLQKRHNQKKEREFTAHTEKTSSRSIP